MTVPFLKKPWEELHREFRWVSFTAANNLKPNHIKETPCFSLASVKHKPRCCLEGLPVIRVGDSVVPSVWINFPGNPSHLTLLNMHITKV